MRRTCKQCGKTFFINDSEINFYKSKNLTLPKRCKNCRKQNKQMKQVYPETAISEKLDDKNPEQRPKRKIWPIVALLLVIIILISAFFIMKHVSVNKSGDSISIIGGADGPTAIFIAGKLGGSDADSDVSEEKMSYQSITMDMAKEIFDTMDGTGVILDVRTAAEYAEGHIKGAINIPNEEIGADEITDLPDKNQIIYVYCRSGNRSKQAAAKLVDLGYTNIIEIGGILDWTGDIEK